MPSNYVETAKNGLNPAIVDADVVVGDFPRCLAEETNAAAATCTSGLPSYGDRVQPLPASLAPRRPASRRAGHTNQQQQQQQDNDNDQAIVYGVPGLANEKSTKRETSNETSNKENKLMDHPDHKR
jgi:hypothetical protein